MRVEPELPDHPKYLRLKRRVGDFALEALIRLWAHCQQNQRGELWRGVDEEYLELIAKWEEQPGLLFRSLLETGWIEQSADGILIHDWEEMNSQIVNNWVNGTKGGRRKKGGVPVERNPMVNPTRTLGVTSDPAAQELGLSAISKAEERNPMVNPIPISGNHPGTQREPVARNVTEHNETKRNDPERDPADGHQDRAGETPALPGGLRYDLGLNLILFLNEQTGADFKGTRSEIDAAAQCLASVGNDFEGVKKMVARQVALWKPTPKTAAWLQPRTLFDEEKFPGYFAQRHLPTDAVTTDPIARRRELEELIQKHPANRQSVFHRSDVTEEQREELKNWRQELSQLSQKNAPQKAASSNA